MKWNIALVIASIAMLLLIVGVELVVPLTQAKAVAEELAPRIGVDKHVVWDNLEPILQRGSLRRSR